MEGVRIGLPGQVQFIIKRLEEHGFEAYAVGGCVRDTLLGRKPGDWDITTSASPAEIKRLFYRTIDTGIAHGTVTVMIERCGYEVTTYRIDGEYEDGRHPKSVEFTANLQEDLKRRDFTINAMAYNDRRGLVDLFDGIGDLKRKKIQCVGEAKERFTEDALRMLRAVRFAAQLGFEIEGDTEEGIRILAPRLIKVSRERIQAELTKLLLSPYPELAEKIFTLGMADQIFPKLAKDYQRADKRQMLGWLTQTEADLILRYTIFLSIIEGTAQERYKEVQNLLKELRFDHITVDYVARLSKYRKDKPGETKEELRKQVVEMGEDIFPYFIKLQKAWQAERLYREIKEAKDCLSVKELAVNGKDLMAAGIKAGKSMGQILNWLLSLVLEKPEWNTREQLLSLAEEEYMRLEKAGILRDGSS